MKIEKDKYLRVQPVEEIKPARAVYNEKKDEKREPEKNEGGESLVDCLA